MHRYQTSSLKLNTNIWIALNIHNSSWNLCLFIKLIMPKLHEILFGYFEFSWLLKFTNNKSGIRQLGTISGKPINDAWFVLFSFTISSNWQKRSVMSYWFWNSVNLIHHMLLKFMPLWWQLSAISSLFHQPSVI